MRGVALPPAESCASHRTVRLMAASARSAVRGRPGPQRGAAAPASRDIARRKQQPHVLGRPQQVDALAAQPAQQQHAGIAGARQVGQVQDEGPPRPATGLAQGVTASSPRRPAIPMVVRSGASDTIRRKAISPDPPRELKATSPRRPKPSLVCRALAYAPGKKRSRRVPEWKSARAQCDTAIRETGACGQPATTGDGWPSHSTGGTRIEAQGGVPSQPKDSESAAEHRRSMLSSIDSRRRSSSARPTPSTRHLDAAIGRSASFFDVDHGVPGPAGSRRRPFVASSPVGPAGVRAARALRPGGSLPWITGPSRQRDPVWVARPDELPPEAAPDRTFLERLGIRSIASLPLIVGGAPVGWLMLGTVRERQVLAASGDRPAQADRRRLVGSALARERADRGAPTRDRVRPGSSPGSRRA